MTVYERRAAGLLFNVLRSLGERRTFLLPGNICPVVPETFRAAGQPFELVDIAEPWLGMDGELCATRAREADVAGVLYVRTYGNEVDPTPLFAALRAVRDDLIIIDDKCLCRPDVHGEFVSPLADVTLFSTGRVKYVDLGQGGWAHLGDRVAYRRQSEGPDWLELAEPEATWNSHRARVEEEAKAADAQKEELNAIYATLPAEVQLPAELQRWRFNIRVPEPDRLVETIFASGLFASRHYAAGAGCPVARQLHTEVVNLFNDRHFDAQRAGRVTELVNRHLERCARPGSPSSHSRRTTPER